MSATRLPFSAEPVEDVVGRRLAAAYPVYRNVGLARYGPSGCLMPADMTPFLQDYYTTPVHPHDIWIVTLPKCGTTWMQEMVWLIMNGCDYSTANCLLCPDRYQFLEIGGLTASHMREQILHGQNPTSRRLHFQNVRDRPKPWFVKTHLPLHFCPPNLLNSAKVVYVARNPKDMCVSYFNHLKMFGERDPSMEMSEFVDLFIRGEVSQLPFFPHVLEAWKLRHHRNMKFVFFEDMKRNLRAIIEQVASFLEKPLTEEQLVGLERHLHFSNMKENPWVNKNMMYAYSPLTAEQLKQKEGATKSEEFMRKGATGDWKNHFTDALSQKLDEWTSKELEGTDLRFVSELDK